MKSMPFISGMFQSVMIMSTGPRQAVQAFAAVAASTKSW